MDTTQLETMDKRSKSLQARFSRESRELIDKWNNTKKTTRKTKQREAKRLADLGTQVLKAEQEYTEMLINVGTQCLAR